jgi:hypothetical protein
MRAPAGCCTIADVVRRGAALASCDDAAALVDSCGSEPRASSALAVARSGSGSACAAARGGRSAGCAASVAVLDRFRARGSVGAAAVLPVAFRLDEVAAVVAALVSACCCRDGKASGVAARSGPVAAPTEAGSPAPALAAAGTAAGNSVVALLTASATERSVLLLPACSWGLGRFTCAAAAAAGLTCGAAAPAMACAHSTLELAAMRWATMLSIPTAAAGPCLRSGSIR